MDPTKWADLRLFKIMPKETQRKYSATWKSFITRNKLAIGQVITEKMAFDFIESKWESGKGHATLKCMYSHLNLFCDGLYGEKLRIFPEIYKFIQTRAKLSPPKKQARCFEPEEVILLTISFTDLFS